MQVTETSPLTSSDLYAISQRAKNKGDQRCHFCGSDCERLFLHDDAPPVPYARTKSTAKFVHNPYVCLGCYLWRRKRQTVFFLTGGLKDVQEVCHHSWLVTEKDAFAIRKEDHSRLMEILTDPPYRFMLALLDNEKDVNLLQLCVANDYPILKEDSQLTFTVNNVAFKYTTYELKTAIEDGNSAGKWPGVDMLFKLLGRPARKEKEKQDRGRPPVQMPDGKVASKEIRRSGQKVEMAGK